jgi:hypothetical protein
MNTKKSLLPLVAVIMILAVVLVACGAKASAATTTTSGTTGGSGGVTANGTPAPRNLTQPLPLAESQLIGTIKLKGTGNAVDAKTAAALVPLWQAYAQLTSSNTAAQAEIDAIVTQIQDTMTPQRIQAITDMKLTRQDLFAAESSLGLTNGFGGNGTGTPRAPGTGGGGGGFFPGGGDAAGGPPGGGDAGGPPGGADRGGGGFGTGGTGGTRPTPNATQQALRTQFANRIPTPLMNALIALLQKAAGA